MNGLLVSWGESLKIFSPKNLLQFLSATATTIVQAYRVWLKYFWWLLVANVVLAFAVAVSPVPVPLGGVSLELLVWFAKLYLHVASRFLLVFTLYLSVRPSIEPKTLSYFLSYWHYCAVYAVFYVVASLGLTYFNNLFYTLQLPHAVFYAYVHVIQNIFMIHPMVGSSYMAHFQYSSPVFIFLTLFYLDSRGGVGDLIWSVWRGIKMLVYNLPFCYLTYWIVGHWLMMPLLSTVSTPFDELAHQYFVGKLGLLIHFLEMFREALGLLYFPLLLGLFSMFYAKRVKEQPNLYYSAKEEV